MILRYRIPLILLILLGYLFSLRAFPHPLHEDPVSVLIRKADSLKRINSEESIHLANIALSSTEETILPPDEAKCYKIIAENLFTKGSLELASNYGYKALEIYREEEMFKDLADILNFLGRINAESQQYEPAIEFIEEAILINDRLKDSSALIDTYLNYAYAFERAGNSDVALGYYLFVDSLNSDPNRKITINEGIASIYEDLEMYDESRIKYLQVLESIDDDLILMISTLNNVGDTYLKKGQFKESLPYYKKSLSLSIENNLKRNLEQNHIDLYKAYVGLNDIKQALFHLEQHTKYYKEVFSENTSRQLAQMNSLHEIEQKNNLLALEKTRASNRTLQRNVLIVGLIILVVILVYFFRLYKKVRTINEELVEKTAKIEKQNNKLIKQKKELEETQALLIQSEKIMPGFPLTLFSV
jgi:tetratricopeptide (TPR) repeat protein